MSLSLCNSVAVTAPELVGFAVISFHGLNYFVNSQLGICYSLKDTGRHMTEWYILV
jgi:hypothetical protein